MKKLHTFSTNDRAQAGLFKGLLAREGVACVLRNEQLFAALGEIPFLECFPELWVIDDEMWPRARMLLDGWLKSEAEMRPPWVCPDCGERLEGQFGACWKCETLRDA